MLHAIFHWFHDQSFGSWVLFSILSNFVIAGSSIAGCWWVQRQFRSRAIFEHPQPLKEHDAALALGCILLNSCVSIAGWVLWKSGWITLTFPGVLRTVFDLAVLLVYMDAGMYVTHLLVHHPALFGIVHQTHHAHVSTNPLSLFVLNPLEVFGFGGLMISALVLFPLSAIAVVLYLNLNILFGTLGHAGVEPFPAGWFANRFVRQIGTSTFHGQHHANPRFNFGFYTVIWDRLFGTIHPDYDRAVKRNALGNAV